MISHRTVHVLLIFALGLAMVVLAILTTIASLASVGRSDCTSFTATSNTSYSTITIVGGTNCTFVDALAETVHNHSSYFQSTHIIIIRLIGTLALLVYKPSLTAMMWSALQIGPAGVPLLHVDAFQEAVGLSSSPALLPAALYVKASRTLPFKVVFVLLVSILSLLSPLAISPIYRPHTGPYFVNATLNTGGGANTETYLDYDSDVYTPKGVSTGRGLLAAGVLMNILVFPKTFDVRVAPFLSMATVDEIWRAEVDIVVARNAVDCSASAPARLNLNSTQHVVALNMSTYFAPGGTTNYSYPTFLGKYLGLISNEPQVTVVYLNTNHSVRPGSVTAETSVIFLAANGSLEGAHQTITSPNPTARIASVDVLICTSTTTLETSHCIISQGNVTSCTALVPPNASASSTGGLGAYISNPISVAIILSASPVMACDSTSDHIPMFFISNSTIASHVPPMSDLAVDTMEDKYHVPLDYITNIVFPQTAQALVQGMNQAMPTMANQSVSLIAIFATSELQLSCLILAICAACAITATISGVVSFRKYPERLDVVRLLAISRNDQLDSVFAPYADLSVPVNEDVLQRRIGYSWVEKLDSRVLVVDK